MPLALKWIESLSHRFADQGATADSRLLKRKLTDDAMRCNPRRSAVFLRSLARANSTAELCSLRVDYYTLMGQEFGEPVAKQRLAEFDALARHKPSPRPARRALRAQGRG